MAANTSQSTTTSFAMVCALQLASKDSATSSGRLQLGDLPFQYGDVLAQLASNARAKVGLRQALLNAR